MSEPPQALAVRRFGYFALQRDLPSETEDPRQCGASAGRRGRLASASRRGKTIIYHIFTEVNRLAFFGFYTQMTEKPPPLSVGC